MTLKGQAEVSDYPANESHVIHCDNLLSSH